MGLQRDYFSYRMQWYVDLRSRQTTEHAPHLATDDHNGKLKVKQIDNRNIKAFDVPILSFTARTAG